MGNVPESDGKERHGEERNGEARTGKARALVSNKKENRQMMNTTEITIRGLTPLIMHNGNLADPLHESAIALAKLSSKRKKTIEDHRQISKVEWYGGLYVTEKGKPCLPGEVIEGAIADGAKKTKRGKDVKAGVVVFGDYELVYEGPKTADGLWKHGGFLKRAGVKLNGKTRIIRSRPIFPQWQVTFVAQWDATIINSESDLLDIVADAGRVGICDWRPKFGRFEVVA